MDYSFRLLLRNSQRLCLPSSLSSVEPVLVVTDEVEEALVIPLATSSEALALADANLVISLMLSLAESIVVLMDSMLATIIGQRPANPEPR